MIRQRRDILHPFAQGRQHDRKDIDPVIEILSEGIAAHRLFQIAVGGGENARLHGDGLGAAEADELALLQHPQELDLGGGGQFPDLVEEYGSNPGQLETSRFLPFRAGESPLFMAEKLALEQGLGQGAAVHGDEGLIGAAAALMNRPRHQFLAGAALPADDHRRIGRSHLFNQLVDFLHCSALADHVLEGETLLELHAQVEVLDAELAFFKNVAHLEAELVDLEGFDDIVKGPALHRLHGGAGIGIGGHEQHLGLRPAGLDPLEQLHSAYACHLDIADDDVEAL
ncbi:MAG: hypothetical protein BWY77_01837 [bacterium ADurb.Bin431]|nr:MAG: hypothetical protein BWY77_01837 [bacterium ADurb.Bin431]